MNRYLAWDVEISAIVPEDTDDWWAHAPLGVSCAAVAWMDEGELKTKTFHGVFDSGEPTPRMSVDECRQMVEYLRRRVDEGFTILTHNGTSFDWRLLAMESGLHAECVELAMNSVDTCLLAHCVKGFPVSLDAIAKGMGLSGKTAGMSGALAPSMWADAQYDEVLEYVTQDVVTTLEVALAIERRGGFLWISRRGRLNACPLPMGLVTAKEALKLPEPNTSWMTSPLRREDLIAWTGVA